MKKLLSKFLLYVIALSVCFSCKKMDSKYKDFIVPGGRVYTEKVRSPHAYSGHNRIKIEWLRGIDPNINKVRIFWNNYSDSVQVDVPPAGDTISYIFENLPEKSYSFIIKTYDKDGNFSVPVEVFGDSYGDNYQSGLLNRFISSAELDSYGSLKVTWGPADISNGVLATEIKYTGKEGGSLIKRFGKDETTTILTDFKPGTELEYRTLYTPDSLSIDTFYTSFERKKVAAKISKSGWTASANSYERVAQLPSGAPEKAIDDDITTYWHSNHTELITGYPYWLAVDMKNPVVVTRIELFSRLAYFTEDFTDFTVQGSMDGSVWASYGTFKMEGKAETQSFIIDGAPEMRYIRIYMTKGVTVHAYLAELTVFGY